MTSRSALSGLLAGLAFLLPARAWADEAWPAKDLQFVVDLGAFTSFAKTQYQNTGELFDLVDSNTKGSVQTLGMTLDTEFGLLPGFSLVANTAFQNVAVKSDYVTSQVRGFSDFTLGGKWQVLSKGLSVTLAPSVKFPTGYTPDPGPFLPSLGNGVNEYNLMAWAGKRFAGAPFFFELGGGYRFRGTRIPRGGGPKLVYGDQIAYGLNVGFQTKSALGLVGIVDGALALGKADSIDTLQMQARVESYTIVGGGLSYQLTDAVDVRATYRTTVAGVDTLNSQFLALSVTAKYGVKDD